jgi:hypothetical protein
MGSDPTFTTPVLNSLKKKVPDKYLMFAPTYSPATGPVLVTPTKVVELNLLGDLHK